MNKTVNINLAGQVFHIDEDAFQTLSEYLETIKRHYTGDEATEIISDIETRIAELFHEKLVKGKQVIMSGDVENAIKILGKPSEIFGDDKVESGKKSWERHDANMGAKRLYRDPDDQVFGGVCAGISHYLNIDPVWLRLLFVIAFLIFGSGLVLYIILWIIIPKANTTAEKLQMKGERVNIKNIEKSLREEIYGIEENVKGAAQDAKMFWKNKGKHTMGNTITRLIEVIGDILRLALLFLVKFFSVLFVLLGLLVLVSVLFSAFGLGTINGISLPLILEQVFDSPFHQNMAIIGLCLIFGIPFLLLLDLGVRTLFNIKRHRYFGSILGVLWIAGFVISCIEIAIAFKSFSQKATYKNEIQLQGSQYNTLLLEVIPDTESFHYHNSSFFFGTNAGWKWNDEICLGHISRMDIVKSHDNEVHLVQMISAQGESRQLAQESARSVTYRFEQTDSILKFNEWFELPQKSKFKFQTMEMILKIPVGKSIYLAPSMQNIIYDIQNVTNTYDRDMTGHVWKMTEKGLECTDC
jgi:phage shock protein PspC (stress-responsive transcriptional regulator)